MKEFHDSTEIHYLTGQALSPPGRGGNSSVKTTYPPRWGGDYGRGKERSIFMLCGAPGGMSVY